MSQYLVLSHIDVQNANAIAGLTWGFPAITSFLGFTHALSRKINETYDVTLSGCAVISNKTYHKVYQPKPYADFEFLQSKNPPVLAKHKAGSPPIIEEGKMNLTVSLVMEIEQPLLFTNDEIKKLENHVEALASQMRLAGGSILKIKNVTLFSASTKKEHEKMRSNIKQRVMPGFVLIDKSHYLHTHFAALKEKDKTTQLLDAWLDFCALRFKAIALDEQNNAEPNESTPAKWQHQPKPESGWLVPLMTGFKAIDDEYSAGEILNLRDSNTHSCFVEAIHSIGEWKSAHSISSIDDAVWRYNHNGSWYLCTQANQPKADKNLNKQKSPTNVSDDIKNITFENALNIFF